MKNNIVIVGAGHGGLIAASELAKNGFNVRIYERSNRKNLGWNWTDDFGREIFDFVGMPFPDENDYYLAGNWTFISPNQSVKVRTHIPKELQKIGMDRQFLISQLLKRAEDNGAKVYFEKNVNGPLIKDDKIVGIRINDEEVSADLVIDSAGIDSPIRKQVPLSYKIQRELHRGDLFYCYRVYYDKIKNINPKDAHKVYFYINEDKRGINWVRNILGQIDVLIGRIDPVNKDYAESVLEEIRFNNPHIGNVIMRGDRFAKIPIRRCISKIVGDNYAIVGDAACMTVPMIGSGINASMAAGKILADAIISIKNDLNKSNSDSIFSTKNLWKYQYEYYRQVNYKIAGIQLMKDFMLSTDPSNLNFLFEKGIITAKDLEASSVGKDVDIPFFDLLGRLMRGFSRMYVLLEIKNLTLKSDNVRNACLNIPKLYSEEIWEKWAQSYNSPFKNYENIIRNYKK